MHISPQKNLKLCKSVSFLLLEYTFHRVPVYFYILSYIWSAVHEGLNSHTGNISILLLLLVLLISYCTNNIHYSYKLLAYESHVDVSQMKLVSECDFGMTCTEADNFLAPPGCCTSLHMGRKILNGNFSVIYGLKIWVCQSSTSAWFVRHQRGDVVLFFFFTCPLPVSHLGQWVCRNTLVGCMHLSHIW